MEPDKQVLHERWGVALEAAGIGVWDWDITTGTATFDDRYYTMAGYEPGAFAGNYDSWRGLVHPEDLGRVERSLQQHLAGARPAYEVEFRFRCADDSWIWIGATGRIVARDPGGEVRRMVGIHVDITERKAADALVESILRGTEATVGPEFFAALVRHLSGATGMDYVFVGELSGDTIRTLAVTAHGNPAENLTYELADTPCAEVVGQRICVFPRQVQERFPEDTLLRDMGVAGYIGLPLFARDGVGIGILVLMDRQPLDEAAVGALLPMLEVFAPRAATELMRLAAEREQRRVEEELRHSQRMESVGQLAGGIAHDFNNMLGGILGYADLLTMKMAEGSQEYEFAAGIARAAERAGELTGNLLAFSRRGRRTSEVFDLHEEVRTVRTLLEHTLDRNIRLELDLAAERICLQGDPAQMQSAVLNLAVNARDAMPDGGRLTIRTRLQVRGPDGEDRRAVIEVADTGTGIEPELRSRVFDPYFTTKGVGEGTGLGLAAVYGTVKEHGGDIEVDSAPGRGSVFRISLPTAAGAPVPVVAACEQPAGEVTVLVIDDEDLVRQVVAAMLASAGYRVLEADGGRAGLARFEEHPEAIDLVVLDMAMPDMNGAECFAALRALDPRVRIIVATGFVEGMGNRDESFPGCAGLLRKPFRRRELLEAVQAALVRGTPT